MSSKQSVEQSTLWPQFKKLFETKNGLIGVWAPYKIMRIFWTKKFGHHWCITFFTRFLAIHGMPYMYMSYVNRHDVNFLTPKISRPF
jgi:hypothetical protein